MKKIKALAFIAAFAFAATAHAQITASVGATADLGVTAATNSAMNSATNAAIGAKSNSSSTAKANSRANATATGTATDTSNTDMNVASYNTLNGSVNLGTGASSSLNTFVLTRDDLLASTSAATAAVMPAAVSTDAQFQTYAHSLMLNDQSVSRVASNDNQVTVWYDQPVSILGFIPASATVQATVDASGNVAVNYPWWYGVFAKGVAQTQVQSDLNDTAGVIARGQASTSLSYSTKARLAHAIESVLKTDATLTASSTASTSASY